MIEELALKLEQLKQFETSNVWQLIKQRVTQDLLVIDSQWHLYDEETSDFRELKLRKRALTYLLNVENIIKLEADNIEKAILTEQSLDTNIALDYDQETKLEDAGEPGGSYGM